MKNKIVKLTEQDLEKLVKKIIKEEGGNTLNPKSFMEWAESLGYMESQSIRQNINMIRVKGDEYFHKQVDETLLEYFSHLGINVSDEERDSFKNTLVDTYRRGIPRLNEQDLEKLVKKIIKEDDYEDDPMYDDEKAHMAAFDTFEEKYPQLAELYDEVLYISPGYKLSHGRAPGVGVFEQVMEAIEMDGVSLTDEAKTLIKRLEYDLSALDGFDERVIKLYETISGQNFND